MQNGTHWKNGLRTIVWPTRRPSVSDGKHPENPTLRKWRWKIAGHALSTLIIMMACGAALPVLIFLIEIVLKGPSADAGAQAWDSVVGIREKRSPGEDRFVLQIVAGLVVASYFFIFQREPTLGDEPHDHSGDPAGEKTFLAVMLGIVLLLGVCAAWWVAVPPNGAPVIRTMGVVGLVLAYICAALARLVMSDHIQTLQWSESQWQRWAATQAVRATELSRSGVTPFGWRSAALASMYLVLPVSLATAVLCGLTSMPPVEAFFYFALLPAVLLGVDFRMSRGRRVTLRWGNFALGKLMLLIIILPALALPLWGAPWIFFIPAWLACLLYGRFAIARRFAGELDLRLLQSSSAPARPPRRTAVDRTYRTVAP